MPEPAKYPKMLYSDDGSTMIVPDEAAEQAAGAGWSDQPSDVHRSPLSTVQPLPSGQEPFVEAVAARTAELVLAALGKTQPPPPTPEPDLATQPAARPAAPKK